MKRGPGGSLPKPIERYIYKTDGCWQWIGAKDESKGLWYGVRVDQGKIRKAHVLVYEKIIGPIPEGLVLDHLCKNTLCVRPDHLEPVTNKENILRGNSPSANNARKTLASCGHPFTGHDGLRRYCKPCRTKWHREYYRRNSAVILERQHAIR